MNAKGLRPKPRPPGERYYLVLSDDEEAHDSPSRVLAQLGARVIRAPLGRDFSALENRGSDVRLVILEPGGRLDRMDLVLRKLRRVFVTPVKMLVAVEERHVARLPLFGGFDDFIVLPHFPAELYARVRRLEDQEVAGGPASGGPPNRAGGPASGGPPNRAGGPLNRAAEPWEVGDGTPIVEIGALRIDRAAFDVRADGKRVHLTPKEFELLWVLGRERGVALSRERLLASVWGTEYEGGARTVDIHVRRLRKKLGGKLPLATVRGAGYRIDS